MSKLDDLIHITYQRGAVDVAENAAYIDYENGNKRYKTIKGAYKALFKEVVQEEIHRLSQRPGNYRPRGTIDMHKLIRCLDARIDEL